jgi:sulfide dehydrogenase [flavocytochrome c] flavoprotein subunit
MLSRREFITATTVGIAGLACFGPFAVSSGAAELFPKTKRRVVIVGGGFGGATAARYLRLYDPGLELILIEPNTHYVTCPSSNLVISGLMKISAITHGYETLQKKLGVRVVHDTVRGIDPLGKYVETGKGKIAYDRLVVSPGIDYMYDGIEGMDAEGRKRFPHAWKAGDQTLLLARELAALKQGGSFLMTVPETPYRCPPGPYERACLVAARLKRTGNKGKVIVLDANPDVASKAALFKAAWSDLYKDIIQYFPDVSLKSVDVAKRRLVTDKGEFTADVINIIPEQRAGSLAFASGLVKPGYRWAASGPLTFESTIHKDIHLIGDAADREQVGSMPHSGFVASSMGKTTAAAIVMLMQGKEPLPPSLENACYSQVSDTESIYITGVFQYDQAARKLVGVKAAGSASKGRSERYTRHYRDWQASIVKDTFG